jgi:hypothetical protein
LIYTSSTPEEGSEANEKLDIFADVTRSHHDPRNRREHQKHEPIKPQTKAHNDPISRLPPFAEKMRQDEKKRKQTAKKEFLQDRAPTSSDELLSKDTVLKIMLTNVAMFIIYLIYKLFS